MNFNITGYQMVELMKLEGYEDVKAIERLYNLMPEGGRYMVDSVLKKKIGSRYEVAIVPNTRAHFWNLYLHVF